MNGQGTEYPVRVVLPEPAPKPIRDRQPPSSRVTLEICRRCWSPVVQGMMEEHLEAVQHRHPPMGADSPEG